MTPLYGNQISSKMSKEMYKLQLLRKDPPPSRLCFLNGCDLAVLLKCELTGYYSTGSYTNTHTSDRDHVSVTYACKE